MSAVNVSSSPAGHRPNARLPVGASSTLAAITIPARSVSAISVEINDSWFRPPFAWNVTKQNSAAISSVGHHRPRRTPWSEPRIRTRADARGAPPPAPYGGAEATARGAGSVGAAGADTLGQ